METVCLDDTLVKYLDSFNLTFDDAEKIASKFYPLSLRKGETFCKRGQNLNSMGILLNGLLYASYNISETKEKVSRFFYVPDNFIVSSFESFTQRERAKETITALESSQLLCVSFDDCEQLYKEIPSMNTIGRKLAEQSYIKAMYRIYCLHAFDAKQRIQHFYKEHRQLILRVQVGHIASYLDMNRNRYTEIVKQLK